MASIPDTLHPGSEIFNYWIWLEHTEYESEQFCTVIYYNEGTVFLLFAIGRIEYTGIAEIRLSSSVTEKYV